MPSKPSLSRFVLLSAVLPILAGSVAACSKADPLAAVPDMPAPWVVKLDETYGSRDSEYLSIEGRLRGKVKTLRVVVYDVQGQPIRLNVIVAADMTQADRMFRNLAFQKQPWSYTRKNQVLYEFAATEEARVHIEQVRERLSR